MPHTATHQTENQQQKYEIRTRARSFFMTQVLAVVKMETRRDGWINPIHTARQSGSNADDELLIHRPAIRVDNRTSSSSAMDHQLFCLSQGEDDYFLLHYHMANHQLILPNKINVQQFCN
ncbi:hypothetical protein OUZ56_002261 [Daphnia magna]|uniref:Uncharacterized protein n=1 Tax=Daphnia magna TaxID=35525 RepID=A0ABR0A534_9CRUS|nr:hypothetical protein OUZ56_002261 [Daphnia magna]